MFCVRSKKLFKGRSRTTESLRIQSENNMQSQIAESIQNLSKNNGGEVSEDAIDRMLSHINPIPASFKDLVSSDKKGSEDVASIPRIDD